MSDLNDYQDEMRDPLRLGDDDIERLLAGKAPAGRSDLSGLADLLGNAPRAIEKMPDERSEHEHLMAIVSAASRLDGAARPVVPAASTPAQPTWRRVVSKTKLLVLRVSAGAGAALLALTGYAYAGGDLPGSTEEALEQLLQVELPDEDKSRSDEVKDAKEAFGDERGCEFGQAVSDAASGKTDRANDPCAKGSDEDDAEKSNNGKSETAPHGKAKGKGKDKSNNGKSATAPHGNANGQSDEKTTGNDKDKTNSGKSDSAPAGNANGQSDEKTTGNDKDKTNSGKSDSAPAGNANGQTGDETDGS